MSSGNFKQELFDQFARIGKAVGSGRRLELLEYLAQSERTVDALAKLARLSVANASQHLRQLHQAGLVLARKEGQFVYYRLADPDVAALLSVVERIAEARLAEVDRLIKSYLAVKDNLEPIPRDELLARAREGLVTVLDVRPKEEFRSGHISGAINVPTSELEQHLDALPRDQEIVAYCRGPYCMLAFEAVARLRAEGYQARRLEEGYPEWQREGLPVEQEEKQEV